MTLESGHRAERQLACCRLQALPDNFLLVSTGYVACFDVYYLYFWCAQHLPFRKVETITIFLLVLTGTVYFLSARSASETHRVWLQKLCMLRRKNLAQQLKNFFHQKHTHHAEACTKFSRPISASLRPGNTALFKEMSRRWRAVGNQGLREGVQGVHRTQA